MSIVKNLGGDRAGSGNKMDIELHAFSSSSHNVRKITRTSQAVGTLVPIFTRLLLKGNKVDIDLNSLLHTNPLEGPMFGEHELQIHAYTAPLSLYQGKMHMNLLDEGTNMENVKFPLIKYVADKIDWDRNPDNQQINSSSIFAYLGDRGLGDALDPETQTEVTRYRNAVKFLMYHDVNANYYVNKQEKVGYIIHNSRDESGIIRMVASDYDETNNDEVPKYPGSANMRWRGVEDPEYKFRLGIVHDPDKYPEYDEILLNVVGEPEGVPITELFNDIFPNGPGVIIAESPKYEFVSTSWNAINNADEGLPQMYEFPLENYNEMKMDILSHVKNNSAFVIDENSIAPFGTSLGKVQSKWSKLSPQEGLAVRTYKSDWFNNWLDTEAIESIDERSRMMVDSEGGITMNSFLLQEKLFKYLNRIQLAGNSVSDWEEASWGIKTDKKSIMPIFEGAMHVKINFDPVISQSADETKPLGTLASTGSFDWNSQKGGKISIKVEEHSMLMIIASIVPLPDYNQGNAWDGDLLTYEDLHSPGKDKIGFQNLITDWMASWDTKIASNGTMTQFSAGKQPSWIQYQTNINETYGTFADETEEWMVNVRKYEGSPATRRIRDLSTYIDPAKWNYPFAYKQREAMNFKMQYLIDAQVRILMSANQIPGL